MPHTLLLKNARLIDGLADQPQTGMSILVTGERISKVERGEIPASPDAQVIDLRGKTVLPGLIDTHVHATLMDPRITPLVSRRRRHQRSRCGSKTGKGASTQSRLEQRRPTRPALVHLWSVTGRRSRKFSAE